MPIDTNNLYRKIRILNELLWEGNVTRNKVDIWLNNFSEEKERLHALYLLSQFMYFGTRQMREMMKVVYRDFFKYPITEKIRKDNGDTLNRDLIQSEFTKELESSRFLAIGNPSESGCHLLYYFRQENNLTKNLFAHSHEIFSWAPGIRTKQDDRLILTEFKNPNIKRYAFFDDFCGSGDQAIQYSRDLVRSIKELDTSVEVHYYMLFGTTKGVDRVRNETEFDTVKCIFELDDSFKCFSETSRYFPGNLNNIDKDYAKSMSLKYGSELPYQMPLGYKGSELVLGFSHNTPDNTISLFWEECPNYPWIPIFKRYHKIYGN